MNKFKSIMMAHHTMNRECLHKIYTDKQVYISSMCSSEQPIEDEKIFSYRNVTFRFSGTGFRTPEKTVLYVQIPRELMEELGNGQRERLEPRKMGCCVEKENIVAYEDFLLRILNGAVNGLAKSFENDHKDAREKAFFALQRVSKRILPRNGCVYDEEKEIFCLRLTFQFPLINGHSLNGKAAFKGMKALLDCICDGLECLDRERLKEQVQTYCRQQEIRRFMERENLLAFVADGSILPRIGESQEPMEGAIPFRTPESLKVEIAFDDGTVITGMGLKRGITVITGGGYSGKSTLLDALEQGIYNHVCGDGREYCLTDSSACKIYAEDGRYLANVNLSSFFSVLPGNKDVKDFSTPRASGSVSQAANIVEAVYGGCRCLLIDEDTSATNFMIRDKMMRRLVEKEPIIPFTDRVEELKEMGVSTVLVIGGSGEYLQYGDCVLMLEDYHVLDRTEEVKAILKEELIFKEEFISKAETVMRNESASKSIEVLNTMDMEKHRWGGERYLAGPEKTKEFYMSQLIQIENARIIRIDDYTADITRLTALGSEEQVSSLTWLIERMLMEIGKEHVDLVQRCRDLTMNLQKDSYEMVFGANSHRFNMCMEQVRELDLMMALFRLRGVEFSQ